MTWGKGGSTNVVQVTTKSRRAASVPAEDLSYEPSVGSKTARTVWSALDHSNDLSLASKRQDRKLLNDIQIRMHKLEFDNVKPGHDVKLKTGFRRFIYGHKPPLEKETKIERRKDELRYPWANRDNFYRAPRKQTRKVKGQEVKEAEQAEDDHYPRHDPLGLYRPRDKKPKAIDPKDLEPSAPSYRDSSTAVQLAKLHAKVKTRPSFDAMTPAYGGFDELGGHDFDTFYAELSRPITRSAPIDFYVPATRDGYQLDGQGELALDTARRIRESRAEIDDFDRLLDTTFSRPYVSRYVSQVAPPTTYRRSYSPLTSRHYADDQVDYVPAPITSSFRASSEPKKFLPSTSLAVRQAKNSLSRIERELGLGAVSIDAPYFEEPVVRTTSIRPVSAVRTGWYKGGAPAPRRTSYRSHSVAARPPPVPRSTRIHEIEVDPSTRFDGLSRGWINVTY